MDVVVEHRAPKDDNSVLAAALVAAVVLHVLLAYAMPKHAPVTIEPLASVDFEVLEQVEPEPQPEVPEPEPEPEPEVVDPPPEPEPPPEPAPAAAPDPAPAEPAPPDPGPEPPTPIDFGMLDPSATGSPDFVVRARPTSPESTTRARPLGNAAVGGTGTGGGGGTGNGAGSGLPPIVDGASLQRSTAPPYSASEMGRRLKQFYPERAEELGVYGTATVTAIVSTRGDLTGFRIVRETSTGAELGDACVRFLRAHREGWTVPLDRDGQPVRTRITYDCRFSPP